MAAVRGKGRGKEEESSALGCCCASIPWVQLACTLAIVGGLIVFFIESGQAFGAVKTLLAELKVASAAQKMTGAALEALLGAGIGVVLMVILLALIALISSLAGNGRRYRVRHGAKVDDAMKCGSWCQMGTSILVIALMWLMLACVVALIAIWTAFMLGCLSGDNGSSLAMGSTDAIQAKIASALRKMDSLLAKMRGAWTRLVNKVPSILKNNSWFTELTTDIGGPLLNGSKDIDTVACADNCLDLGVFASMVSFDPRCVCGKEMLTNIQTKSRVGWKGSLGALIALVVIAIAGSWILMAQISELVNARRDLADIGDISKAQAEDEFTTEDPAAAPAKVAMNAGDDVEAAAADQVAKP